MKGSEFVPNDRAIFRSDKANTYQCPQCKRPIFSTYEGDAPLMPHGVQCHGLGRGHTLTWEAPTAPMDVSDWPRTHLTSPKKRY